MQKLSSNLCLCAIAITALPGCAQQDAPRTKVDVRMQIAFDQPAKRHFPPAVMWLTPLQPTHTATFLPHEHYTLTQKNRTFIPHLLVVPVGALVLFPNEDPFFHNVFSLFDGKRFDLGLYEAGSAKGVTFSREGISYIFCNIHPEMSAVVVALSTPFHAVADPKGNFRLNAVPEGSYELHVWIEGIPQPDLDPLRRTIHLTTETSDLGVVNLSAVPKLPATHLNEFGQPYAPSPQTSY